MQVANIRNEAAEVRRRRIQRDRQEQEQARQIAQVIAISKDTDGSWRRGLLLLVADNFLANVPEVKVKRLSLKKISMWKNTYVS